MRSWSKNVGVSVVFCYLFLVGIRAAYGTESTDIDQKPGSVNSGPSGSSLLGEAEATGGMGGLLIRRIEIDQNPTFLFGGTGGGYFNRYFELGGSVLSTLGNQKEYGETKRKVSLLYTELRLGVNLFPQYIIYPKLNFEFGIGHIGFHKETDSDNKKSLSEFKNFLVADPGIMLIVNVTNKMQAGIGVSYSRAFGLGDTDGFKEEYLEGLAVTGQITFGFF